MPKKYSLIQKLRIKVFGSVPVESKIIAKEYDPVMFYAFECPIHGIVEDYPRGKGKRLICLKCLESKWK